MSVFYEVYEHLSIDDTTAHCDEFKLASSQMEHLGAWIAYGRASTGKITVIADGTEHSFSGHDMTEEFDTMLDALRKAKKVEIISDYTYSGGGYIEPGPFPMIGHLAQIAKEDPERLDGMFYSMYYNVDCDDSVGDMLVYGKKNGII